MLKGGHPEAGGDPERARRVHDGHVRRGRPDRQRAGALRPHAVGRLESQRSQVRRKYLPLIANITNHAAFFSPLYN